MRPVLFALAKMESAYIEEWVKYHLALGFDHIYIYDNEDTPTYCNLLKKYTQVTCIHKPGNSYNRGIHYVVLDDFVKNIMGKNGMTHAANIDIDEFIVLKKHANIKEFIRAYIKGDCVGIGMNWRLFGSSGLTDISSTPVTIRFTQCESSANQHVKTLFDIKYFNGWQTMHYAVPKKGVFIKDTAGTIITGPFNKSGDISVIQLNHYKCKTLAEYKLARQRGRAGLPLQQHIKENIESDYEHHNRNDVTDLYAKDFYMKKCLQ